MKKRRIGFSDKLVQRVFPIIFVFLLGCICGLYLTETKLQETKNTQNDLQTTNSVQTLKQNCNIEEDVYPLSRALNPLKLGLHGYNKRTHRPRTFRILSAAVNEGASELYKKILITNGWTQTRRSDAFLYLHSSLRPKDMSKNHFHPEKMLVNHFFNDRSFLRKEPMYKAFKKYAELNECDMFQATPQTYLLHMQEDCLKFFTADIDPESIWYSKPLSGSYGVGVTKRVYKEYKESMLKKRSLRTLCSSSGPYRSGLLIQRGVESKLIKDAKFDIRAYLFIARSNPWHVYFHKGYLRRSMIPMSEVNGTHGRYAHITNTHFQVKMPGFTWAEHQWPVDRLMSHLVEEEGISEEVVFNNVHRKMKELFLYSFFSIKDKLPPITGQFVLLGLDAMISPQLDVKLLEINTNPELHYNNVRYGDASVVRGYQVVSDMMCLVMEIQNDQEDGIKDRVYDEEYLHKHTPCTNNNFELLYTDAVDPPLSFMNGPCFDGTPMKP